MTTTTAQFVDYDARHARAHAEALDPARDCLFAEPPPVVLTVADLPKLRRQIALVHQATAHGFASLGVPIKLRALVSVIIAAAVAAETEAVKAGRTIFVEDVAKFKASYATLIDLLYHSGDGRTFEAKKKEVARLLQALRKWQIAQGKTLCTIRPGGRTERQQTPVPAQGGQPRPAARVGGYEYHETEFELSFLNAIARALLHNPDPARMRSVVRAEVNAMYKLPPFDARWQVKSPQPEEIQRRDRKAAVHKALKAALTEHDLGGDLGAYLDELAAAQAAAARALDKEAEIRTHAQHLSAVEVREHAIRAALAEVLTPYQTEHDDKASIEKGELSTEGGG